MNQSIGTGSLTKAAMCVAALSVAEFASTRPTKIGDDTYYWSKTNTAGIFGDVTARSGN